MTELVHQIQNPVVSWGAIAYLIPIPVFCLGLMMNMSKRVSVILGIITGGNIFMGVAFAGIFKMATHKPQISLQSSYLPAGGTPVPRNNVSSISLPPRGTEVASQMDEGERDAQRHFTEKQRQAIFQRDNYQCRVCGTHEDLQADHIFPHSQGGRTTVDNGQTLCGVHNRLKSDDVVG